MVGHQPSLAQPREHAPRIKGEKKYIGNVSRKTPLDLVAIEALKQVALAMHSLKGPFISFRHSL